MPSKIDMINRVLSELGRNAVSAETDSDAALYVSAKLDELYQEFLLVRNWSWTVKYRSDNTPLTQNFSPDYVYTYQLPADYGKFFKWASTGAQWPIYQFVNGLLLANTRPVQYYYIVASTTYEIIRPLSARALVLYTACKSALTITNSESLTKYLKAEYKEALIKAILQDDMERSVMMGPYNDFDRMNLV